MIHVQDLFYNIPSWKRAMKGKGSKREECDRILSVMWRYAVHEVKLGVGFLCRGEFPAAADNITNHNTTKPGYKQTRKEDRPQNKSE